MFGEHAAVPLRRSDQGVLYRFAELAFLAERKHRPAHPVLLIIRGTEQTRLGSPGWCILEIPLNSNSKRPEVLTVSQVTRDCGANHCLLVSNSLMLQVLWKGPAMNANTPNKLEFQNILHLTDFSPCSTEALSWATSLARAQGSKLFILNVVIPDTLVYLAPGSPAVAFDMQEEWALGEMKRVEDQLAEIPHTVAIVRGRDLWQVVETKLKEWNIDLIVLGTHGRTGLRRALMGSAAERVLRNSPVPVMTVGPEVPPGLTHDCQFHKVLLATDFAEGSAETANYAVSFAKRHNAELTMVHVCRRNRRGGAEQPWDLSIAEAMHHLHELVPGPPVMDERPDHLVECGEPGPRILDVAKRKDVDLIVMGVRNTSHVFAATHVGSNTAHEVVAHSPCPVLTVRPQAQAVV